MSQRITTQVQLSDAQFRSIEVRYGGFVCLFVDHGSLIVHAGVGGFPVDSVFMGEQCQEKQGDDVVQEQEEQGPLEFSDDHFDNCADALDKLHDSEQESVESVDMAS